MVGYTSDFYLVFAYFYSITSVMITTSTYTGDLAYRQDRKVVEPKTMHDHPWNLGLPFSFRYSHHFSYAVNSIHQ
jgi:hypothetical protein